MQEMNSHAEKHVTKTVRDSSLADPGAEIGVLTKYFLSELSEVIIYFEFNNLNPSTFF